MRFSRFFKPFLVAVVLAVPMQAGAAFDSAAAAKSAGKDLQIIRLTPSGENVPAGKQIVLQFNRPVVPLGKMERAAAEIPVTITPALPCEWRWINTSALACNLPDAHPLQLATKYTLAMEPGIKAEDGATLATTYNGDFTTQRPAVNAHNFYLWKSPGHPIVRLTFNQPVDKQSAAQHIYFAVGDEQERVALKVSPDPEDRDQPRFLPVPGEKYGFFITNGAAQKSDEDLHLDHGREARRVWLFEANKELPLDTHIVMKEEPGLLSALGAEAGDTANDRVAFDTYPAFAFIGIECTNNKGETRRSDSGEDPGNKCNPMQTIQLVFSAPVERSKMGSMLKFTPSIGKWKRNSSDDDSAEAPVEDTASIGDEYRQPHTKGREYRIWIPPGLKAAQEYTLQSNAQTLSFFARLSHWVQALFMRVDPIDVRDIFGRELKQPVMVRFDTDHRVPNFVLDYSDAVLEKNVDSEVPFYVNNLKNYSFDYRRVTQTGAQKGLTFNQAVANVQDIQYAVPFGVRKMLDGKSGAVFGALHTDPDLGNPPPHLFAQVTPFQVHLKLGHFNTLVWVTDMATGAPVEGASVSFYIDAFTTLQAPAAVKAKAVTDAFGAAVLPGTDTLDPDLSITHRYDEKDKRYFVRVEKGEDIALLPVSDSFEISSYHYSDSHSIYPSSKQLYGHTQAWGTTAQGVYRAGDTIQYKIYVRGQDNNGFIPAPAKTYTLKIIDPTGKVVNTVKNVVLSAFGGLSGEYMVPKEGAVGWYNFKLVADFAKKSSGDEDVSEEGGDDGAATDGDVAAEADDKDKDKKSWVAMRVLVSDFTPASFRVTNQLSGDQFHAGQNVDVTTFAELHSGGAYTDAAARITAMLDSATFTSKNPLVKDFSFDSYKSETSSQQIFQKIDKVNDKGQLALGFSTGEPKIVFGKLTVESAVADDRGKYISGQSQADYIGVDRLVGLHSKSWIYQVGKPAAVEYAVVDNKGNPVKGTAVDIAIEHQVTKAARVKGAGNAYLTEYHTEYEPAGKCKGTSTEAPQECSFTPAKAGTYRVTAEIKDTAGHDHATELSSYATGGDFVVWDDNGANALTIIPESKDYKVGDTARYLVKNPYPGAKALITIERYGVLDHFVQTFDASTPVVEFKIKPEYLPGFYLSVVVTSPRVEKPPAEGQVDLGKPTYRMGYVSVPVKDPYKEMVVTAKPDRDVYRPRDKVTVALHAEPRVKDKSEPVELTVAVLDEAVFDLITGGKAYFDPYSGFYRLDSLDLRNYSLLTRLVGRQKFEKKGANPGGDGGNDVSMRSMFKFISYWNAELKTDASGNATVSFDAPDNLTGWRILALAATPSDRFGLGDANFKVNRPTEVRPVMPNQVMEGDTFDAGFSVMNRTDKPRTVTVKIHAEGNIDTAKTPADITKQVTLAPFKRATVLMPVQTTAVERTRDAKGELRFTATASDAIDSDGMKQALPVNKRRGIDVAANYGTTTQDKVEEPIQFPKEMLPDAGNISVVTSPTVIGNVAGAFKYMRDYPYICWEQKLSKAVMASHYKNLKAYLPDTLLWEGSNTLTQSTLSEASTFQAPNGGMAYFTARDEYVDPYLSAYTAIGFNWLRKSGYAIPDEVEAHLQKYLSNLLKNDAVPDFYSEGMTSTVRAVALAALAERGKAALADLQRYQPHVPKMSLFGKSYFMQAAINIKGGEKYLPDVAKLILASSNETGGKFMFNETWDDTYSRILATPLRENCAVLDAFTAYGERPDGAELVSDIPFKLVRAITQDRKSRDHWENTQENMFCMNALIDYARVYEKDKPQMNVKALLDNEPIGQTSFNDVRNPPVTLGRPVGPNDPGKHATMTIERTGQGRLYYSTQLSYALPMEMSQPANAGIETHREYSVERGGKWQLLSSPADVKRGELVRVDIYLSVPAARNFVVVDDPVPGGLEPVNRDLATTSKVDAAKGEFEAAGGSLWFKFKDWVDFGASRWSFYHQELRHDSVRFYSDYLPPGNYHLSYAAQAIATGTFSALPTIAQEMYDPDVYGKTPGLMLKVGEPPAVAPSPSAPAAK